MPGRFTAEQLFRPFLRGPGTTRTSSFPGIGTAVWAGLVNVTTAGAVSSVATTLVDSDSLIFLTLQGPTLATSTAARAVLVSSINPGVGFTISTTDNNAPLVNYTVHWMIWRTQ